MSTERRYFSVVSNLEEDTAGLGETLARRCAGGTIIALDGGLGAGKTVFTKGFARGLGIQQEITSPSYAIIQEYEGSPGLVHMDWYRMGGEDELLQIGVEEYFTEDSIVLIEWASRAPELLPDRSITITLEIQKESTQRQLTLSIPVTAPERILSWAGETLGEVRDADA